MKKTLVIIVIFLVFAAGVALAFATFLNPKKVVTQRFNECVLMQDKINDIVGCFGCANNICKDAPENWVIFTPKIGTTYSCVAEKTGCELKQ